jgi:hypothetical protein
MQLLELGESRIAVRELGDEQLERARRNAEPRRHGYASPGEGTEVRAFAPYYRCVARRDIGEEQSQRQIATRMLLHRTNMRRQRHTQKWLTHAISAEASPDLNARCG